MAGDQNKFRVAMTHAERFSEQGNWPEAIKAYRFALGEFPNNEAAVVGFGKVTLAAGQAELAWRAFQQALKINPGNYEALNYIGEIQERTGQLDAAAETYLRLGYILAARNDLEAAMEAWLRATRLGVDKLDAHQKLAEAFNQQGQPRQAARQLLATAEIYQRRGDEAQALRQIKEAQDLIGDDPGIVAAFEALEQGTPVQPEEIVETPFSEGVPDFANYTLADDFFDEEDPFAVEDELEAGAGARSGLLDHAQQNAMAELADIIFEDESKTGALTATLPREQINKLIVQAMDLQRRGNLVEATNHYRQVVQAGAGRPALYFNLGLLYKEQGQFADSAKMLKMSAQDKAYNVSSLLALGQTYYAANNLDLAVKHFVELLKMVDLRTVSGQKAYDLSQMYDNLVNSYDTQGDSKKIKSFITALEKFFAYPNWEQRAVDARRRMDSVTEDGNVMSLVEFLETPETEVVITTMATTAEYMKRNLLMTASEECLRAIQRAPAYLPLHVRLADILLKQEHTDQAITKYLYIAKVYQMRHQLDQAINVYQKVLRLAPMDVIVRTRLIELYISHHNVEQALEQYLLLADSYYQLAQVDRAIEKYNEALRLTANSSTANTWKVDILSHIGDIYDQRFDWVRATAAFEELHKINPKDERTQRQLIDLYYKQNKVNPAIAMLDNLLAVYQRQAPTRALEFLKELSSLYREDMALRQRLAIAYVQNGMNREAIAEYDALGEMQLENGLRSQAMQTIQAIINLEPEDIEGYHRLLAQISGGAV